jgi:peptidoglycan/xylan/chitin deacetylase (PgdA/CDA1 family)
MSANGATGGELSLGSAPYYWLRAGFERARLAVAQPSAPPRAFVRILAYHRVSRDRDFLSVPPDDFRRHLELVLEHGFTPLPLQRAVELLARGGALEDRAVCVTFDDGYLDNVEAALPHLDELGIPATIFLPTDVISGAATYHWYETPPPALTWDDARAAAAGGVVAFEAHGTTHRSLPTLSDDELRAELVDSKETIERELGGPVRVFCYPAGRHGDREARMAQAVGYAAAVTTQPGVNVPGTDPFRLRRTTIAWSDSVRTFERKLLGALDTLSGVERWVRARRSRA